MAHFGVVCLLALLIAFVGADMYMHCPRGSNNRLNGSGTNRDNNNRMCDTQNNAKGGYVYGPPMYYYVGSLLTIEWTNQHGCGPDARQKNVHCEIIIQYMCGGQVRDGVTETTIPDDEATYNNMIMDPTADATFGGGTELRYQYGMHESFQYYQDCKRRERNKGLYTAGRGLGDSARSTRQNNNGGRSGFECPEERDYYPYWHPTPWKDIAVLTSDESRCDYYIQKSENNRGKNYCSIPDFNNAYTCREGGGSWRMTDSNGAPGPACESAPMSRDNHLGNGVGGYANTFNWTIPDDENDHCVLRLRYNISTGDYNGWRTDSNSNGNPPIKNNPFKDFGGKNLSYAVNTAQFGRTFQDRSFTFAIRDRPSRIVSSKRIFNLNVRGKRGNIVQVYPAVEYDFVPVRLTVRKGDNIHFQWTGGDTNPNGNDGEGTRGTDRSNMVEMSDISKNLANSLDDTSFFTTSVAMIFAHLRQENCTDYETLLANNGGNAGEAARDPNNCAKLNAADRYFDGGLQEVRANGEFHFVSTRNNNFSNRSQKSTISVVPFLPVWAIVLVTLGGFVCLLSIGLSGLAFYGKARPDTFIGQTWLKLT